jgi:hypothetical protein
MRSDTPSSSQTPKSDTKLTSYNLMGGDLKAHKVQVTGTMSDEKTKHNDTTAGTAGTLAIAGGTLKVTSVKMMASSCP